MAENKKSFILYADQIGIFDKLSDAKAGKLIKLIFQYINDQNPVTDDTLLQIAFEPIKLQLKRDLKEWDLAKKQRSDSGRLGNLKRWHKDLFDKVVSAEMDIEEAENIAKNRSAIGCDTVRHGAIAKIAVTVTDTVTVNDINTTLPAKKWNTKPAEEELSLELPEITEGAVIQQYRFTKNKVVTQKQVAGLWSVFKAQNFTGEKFYQSQKQVFSHFINWCKTQEIKDNQEPEKQGPQQSFELKRV